MLDNINLLVLLFASLGLWVILLTTEVLKRQGIIQGENARKAIHIFSGFWLALLPVVANRQEIIIINLIFFAGVVLFVGLLHRFSAIEDVRRWSWGHFLYPLGLLLVALLVEDLVIYSFATLELALADGYAAVIGKRFGEYRYHIFGANKTLLGSTVFFAITLTLLTVYITNYGLADPLTMTLAVAGALALTMLEGSIAAGFDNLFIPIAMAGVLLAL